MMTSLTGRMPSLGEARWRLATRAAKAAPEEQLPAPRQRFEALLAELENYSPAEAPASRSFDWQRVGPWAAAASAGVLVFQAAITSILVGIVWLALLVAHASPGVGHSGNVSASSEGVIYNAPAEQAAPAPPDGPAWLVWPAVGRISQPMWAGHPTGIDVALDSRTPIRAIRDGTVIFAGGDPCCVYGLFIIVQHDNGWTSLYAHLSVVAVKAGEQVHQSELIALSGETGHVSGPHLHFELRSYGTPVDPLDYLAPPSGR